MLRYLANDQGLIRCLIHQVKAILKTDRRWRADMAGGKIDALLASDNPPPQVIMAPYEGVAQGRGRPHAAA